MRSFTVQGSSTWVLEKSKLKKNGQWKNVTFASKSVLFTNLLYLTTGDWVNARSHKLCSWKRCQFSAHLCQEISQRQELQMTSTSVQWHSICCSNLIFLHFAFCILESKHGGLTVYDVSHLLLLSKCKISQCQLGLSPTRVRGVSYQALFAQLPLPGRLPAPTRALSGALIKHRQHFEALLAV